jgi:hypothetical protein
VHDIVDVGCATGLSSLELLRAFPQASVVGIDLSPHFLAGGSPEWLPPEWLGSASTEQWGIGPLVGGASGLLGLVWHEIFLRGMRTWSPSCSSSPPVPH